MTQKSSRTVRTRRDGTPGALRLAIGALLAVGLSLSARTSSASCAKNECWFGPGYEWFHYELSIEDTWDLTISGVPCTAVITQAACATLGVGQTVAITAEIDCPILFGGTFTGTFDGPDEGGPGYILLTGAGAQSLAFDIPVLSAEPGPNGVVCVESTSPAGGAGLSTMTGTWHVGGVGDTATATRRCRNGTLDAGEACDSGACCTTSTCQVAAASSLCGETLGVCDAQDTCDGVSATTCPDAKAIDGTSCDDGNACTLGDGCAAGACASGAPVECPLCERCNQASGECYAYPRQSCAFSLPLKSSLLLKKTASGVGDQAVLKWTGGADPINTSDFGDPLSSENYALCVYDLVGNPLLRSTAAAGGLCGAKPCWKALSTKGFVYKSTLREPDGAAKVLLKSGAAGKGKVQFQGKGLNLMDFALPLSDGAIAEVQSSSGRCWAALFFPGFASKNDATQFKGKNHLF